MSTQSTHYSAHPVFMGTHDTWTHINATVSTHGNTVTCTAHIQYTWIHMNIQQTYTGHTDIINTCTKYASVHGFMDSHGPMYTQHRAHLAHMDTQYTNTQGICMHMYTYSVYMDTYTLMDTH